MVPGRDSKIKIIKIVMEGSKDDKLEGMEEDMKVEIINLAIQQLMEEKKKNKDISDHENQKQDEDHDLLFSKLLSQVELLKDQDNNSSTLPDEPLAETKDNSSTLPDEPLAETKDNSSTLPDEPLAETKDNSSTLPDEPLAETTEPLPLTSEDMIKEEKEMGTEEIVKELRKLKKQNTITHCLLSLMIVLTVAWQYSEVSLILRLKNTLSNPFGLVGNFIKGAIAGNGSSKNGEGHEIDIATAARNSISQLETPSLPQLHIPDLPYMDMPVLGLHNDAAGPHSGARVGGSDED